MYLRQGRGHGAHEQLGLCRARHYLAERTLRKAVLWRKSSFGSASPDGSRFVERMLTVCESLRAQGRSILEFVEESIRAKLCGQLQPSLVPASAA